MLKVTTSPTWQWSSRPCASGSGSRLPIAINAGPMSVKQAFLPRSLDFSFAFKYRR